MSKVMCYGNGTHRSAKRLGVWLWCMALLGAATAPVELATGAEDNAVDAAEPVNTPEIDPTTPAPLTLYQPPTRIAPARPRYPELERRALAEGWVSLNFMVSPEGKPYEITVTDSIGGKAFESSAIAALEKTRYTPASLDGKPIDAGQNFGFSFVIEGGVPYARRAFVKRYRNVMKFAGVGDLDQALKELTQMQPRNLYEDAYYQSGLAMIATKKREPEAVKRAARRALQRSEIHDNEPYLPKELVRQLTQMLMLAELETFDLVAAERSAHSLLKEETDTAAISRLESVLASVNQVRHSTGYFDVHGEINVDYG